MFILNYPKLFQNKRHVLTFLVFVFYQHHFDDQSHAMVWNE